MDYQQEREKILTEIGNLDNNSFEWVTLEVFRFQARFNKTYAAFLNLIGVDYQSINDISRIPFLPIQLFKSNEVQTGEWLPETVFLSSRTTGATPSRHLVNDIGWYQKNATDSFTRFYGAPTEWAFLALLPSYLERSGSSLILMMQHFIQLSKYPESGFFLSDMENLQNKLLDLQRRRVPTILFGVSYALLDFEEIFSESLDNVLIMETGGMKGRRKELPKNELQAQLMRTFGVDSIHSEYGMTELFSQAYSSGGGIYRCSPTLKVLASEIQDPFQLVSTGKPGILNFIDLANFDTCSFIQTEDLGRVAQDGSFEIIGRLDSSEMRGCNLLVE